MIIKNGTLVTPFQIKKADVLTEGNRIKAIGDFSSAPDDTVDAEGLYVCPGLVDIHTHGGFGADFMDATEESFSNALRFHLEHGTTSLLATSVTAPIRQIQDMLASVRRFMTASPAACRLLGAHLEGPFLSVKNKGAQKLEYLQVPARDGYDFIKENRDIIVKVTISPELDGAAEMTADLTSMGIVVAGGHDDGEKNSIIPVIDAGMTNCTHWYCAMSMVAMRNNVRSVGLVELGLIDDRLTLELIADNHHLPPELVKLAYRCKGAQKVCVVSDCLRAGGMPMDGRLYSLGTDKDLTAQRFKVAEGVAVLPDDSRYAGSIQPIGKMVKNLVKDCQIPLTDAVCMATYTPACIIHKENDIGSLSPGKLADFCIMNSNLEVVKTIVNGRILYIKKGN